MRKETAPLGTGVRAPPGGDGACNPPPHALSSVAMNNPNYPILEILVRLGIALGLGILVFIVPIAIRNARFAPTTLRRVLHVLLALVAAGGFAFGVYYMFQHWIPASPDDERPAPVEYPSVPQN